MKLPCGFPKFHLKIIYKLKPVYSQGFFIASLCGLLSLCFPQQTFVGSYSLHHSGVFCWLDTFFFIASRWNSIRLLRTKSFLVIFISWKPVGLVITDLKETFFMGQSVDLIVQTITIPKRSLLSVGLLSARGCDFCAAFRPQIWSVAVV